MSTDKENWRDNYDYNGDASRDGNNSSYNRVNNYNRDGYNNRDRSERPFRSSYNRYNNEEQRPARPRINREGNNDGRPRINRSEQRPQRSYNNNREGREYGNQNRDYNNQNRDYNNRGNSYNRERSYNREDRPWRQNTDERGGEASRFRRPTPNSGGGNEERSRRPRFNSGNSGGYNNRGQSFSRPRPRTDGYNPHAKYSQKKQIEYKEQFVDPDAPIRLNKFLANAGICSRREADEYITTGVVSVNGEVVTELGTKIKRSDIVKFHDEPVSIERKVYVLLNKPKNCVTTSEDPQERHTVMDLVKNACDQRIYPVGRLDRNTTGVLLLTNDGDLASKLTHPKFLKKKIYHVFLDKNISKADMDRIAEGIQLDDGEIKADSIQYTSDQDRSQVGIEIHSGKNRIVRRIFESLGYKVIKLDRVYFAGLTKKNLRKGDWRFLTEQEVNFLRMGSFE